MTVCQQCFQIKSHFLLGGSAQLRRQLPRPSANYGELKTTGSDTSINVFSRSLLSGTVTYVVGMHVVCLSDVKLTAQEELRAAHVHAQSPFFLAVKPELFILYPLELQHGRKKKLKKKRSLRNEKLKANRTSETEEQRKERLRIRREKDRARRRTKGKKRSPDADDSEKQRLATLKRLKQVKLT